MKPSEIKRRLHRYERVARQIAAGLDGHPFDWTGGEMLWYKPKAAEMGVTLVTRSQLERMGYRLKRGAQPVGSGYFLAPASRSADLYVLECQAVKAQDSDVAERDFGT